MAMRIPVPKRTQGDGMEEEAAHSKLNQNVDKDASVHMSSYEPLRALNIRMPKIDVSPRISAKEIMKSKNLISLKPGTVSKKIKESLIHIQSKEPKFVPFEPYKAAVRPIIPKNKDTLKRKVLVEARKGIESCNSEIKSEPNLKDVIFVEKDEVIRKFEEELKNLKLDNSELEKQLNYQVQVNGELKHLLVAAVGEDMETRVNSLTEDKLHLAQALLNSAKTLSTHQEQVEWLASQCEVWRSKFLASSVMVEELAGWKASLSQKINETYDVVRRLMDERRSLRRNLLHFYGNLVELRDNFDLQSKRSCLKTSNSLELSSQLCEISDGLKVQLLGGNRKTTMDSIASELPQLTEGEQAADYMLKNPHPIHLIGDPDAACSAVMGAAVALSGQIYHQTHPPRIACCAQCTGKIQLV